MHVSAMCSWDGSYGISTERYVNLTFTDCKVHLMQVHTMHVKVQCVAVSEVVGSVGIPH